MPSIARSVNWFVRITAPQEFVKQKLQLLSVECVKLIAVYHQGEKGDNPHVHFCCTVLKELQKQSWDTKIKKMFDVSGNAQFSTEVWDGDLNRESGCAGSYLFHEGLDSPVLAIKGISAEELEEIKATAKLVNKVIAANREKASTKIPDKVIAKWVADQKNPWDDYAIVKCICALARDGECYLPKSDWQWKAYVEEIKLKMCKNPDEFSQFTYNTYVRLFPQR